MRGLTNSARKFSFFILSEIKKIAKEDFVKTFAKLLGASVLSQLISIAASVVLSRLYTPKDFGILSLFTVLTTQLSVFTSMRFEWAITSPEEDNEAIKLVLFSCFIALFTSVSFGALVLISTENVFAYLNLSSLQPYSLLLPIVVFSAGIFQILSFWALRKKNFSIVANAQVSKSIWGNFSQVFLGLFNVGTLGLLTGFVAQQIVGFASLLSFFLTSIRGLKVNTSFKDFTNVFKAHRQFALVCIFSSSLNYAALSAPPLLLTFYYGTETVGYFSLAQRFTNLPAIFIGASVFQSYFAHASELIKTDPQQLKKLHFRTTALLFLFALLFSTAIFFTSPYVVPVIFGANWHKSAVMSQYLAVSLVTTLCVSPLTMLEWLDKKTEILVWHTVRLLFMIGGFWLSSFYGLSSEQAVLILSMITTFMYAVLFYLNRLAIKELISHSP